MIIIRIAIVGCMCRKVNGRIRRIAMTAIRSLTLHYKDQGRTGGKMQPCVCEIQSIPPRIF